MRSYPASKVTEQGIKGTVQTMTGYALAYRMPNGDVVASGGNGYYYEKLGIFSPDGGKGYMAAVCRLNLPPAYLK